MYIFKCVAALAALQLSLVQSIDESVVVKQAQNQIQKQAEVEKETQSQAEKVKVKEKEGVKEKQVVNEEEVAVSMGTLLIGDMAGGGVISGPESSSATSKTGPGMAGPGMAGTNAKAEQKAAAAPAAPPPDDDYQPPIKEIQEDRKLPWNNLGHTEQQVKVYRTIKRLLLVEKDREEIELREKMKKEGIKSSDDESAAKAKQDLVKGTIESKSMPKWRKIFLEDGKMRLDGLRKAKTQMESELKSGQQLERNPATGGEFSGGLDSSGTLGGIGVSQKLGQNLSPAVYREMLIDRFVDLVRMHGGYGKYHDVDGGEEIQSKGKNGGGTAAFGKNNKLLENFITRGYTHNEADSNEKSLDQVHQWSESRVTDSEIKEKKDYLKKEKIQESGNKNVLGKKSIEGEFLYPDWRAVYIAHRNKIEEDTALYDKTTDELKTKADESCSTWPRLKVIVEGEINNYRMKEWRKENGIEIENLSGEATKSVVNPGPSVSGNHYDEDSGESGGQACLGGPCNGINGGSLEHKSIYSPKPKYIECGFTLDQLNDARRNAGSYMLCGIPFFTPKGLNSVFFGFIPWYICLPFQCILLVGVVWLILYEMKIVGMPGWLHKITGDKRTAKQLHAEGLNPSGKTTVGGRSTGSTKKSSQISQPPKSTNSMRQSSHTDDTAPDSINSRADDSRTTRADNSRTTRADNSRTTRADNSRTTRADNTRTTRADNTQITAAREIIDIDPDSFIQEILDRGTVEDEDGEQSEHESDSFHKLIKELDDHEAVRNAKDGTARPRESAKIGKVFDPFVKGGEIKDVKGRSIEDAIRNAGSTAGGSSKTLSVEDAIKNASRNKRGTVDAGGTGAGNAGDGGKANKVDKTKLLLEAKAKAGLAGKSPSISDTHTEILSEEENQGSSRPDGPSGPTSGWRRDSSRTSGRKDSNTRKDSSSRKDSGTKKDSSSKLKKSKSSISPDSPKKPKAKSKKKAEKKASSLSSESSSGSSISGVETKTGQGSPRAKAGSPKKAKPKAKKKHHWYSETSDSESSESSSEDSPKSKAKSKASPKKDGSSPKTKSKSKSKSSPKKKGKAKAAASSSSSSGSGSSDSSSDSDEDEAAGAGKKGAAKKGAAKKAKSGAANGKKPIPIFNYYPGPSPSDETRQIIDKISKQTSPTKKIQPGANTGGGSRSSLKEIRVETVKGAGNLNHHHKVQIGHQMTKKETATQPVKKQVGGRKDSSVSHASAVSTNSLKGIMIVGGSPSYPPQGSPSFEEIGLGDSPTYHENPVGSPSYDESFEESFKLLTNRSRKSPGRSPGRGAGRINCWNPSASSQGRGASGRNPNGNPGASSSSWKCGRPKGSASPSPKHSPLQTPVLEIQKTYVYYGGSPSNRFIIHGDSPHLSPSIRKKMKPISPQRVRSSQQVKSSQKSPQRKDTGNANGTDGKNNNSRNPKSPVVSPSAISPGRSQDSRYSVWRQSPDRVEIKNGNSLEKNTPTDKERKIPSNKVKADRVWDPDRSPKASGSSRMETRTENQGGRENQVGRLAQSPGKGRVRARTRTITDENQEAKNLISPSQWL